MIESLGSLCMIKFWVGLYGAFLESRDSHGRFVIDLLTPTFPSCLVTIVRYLPLVSGRTKGVL